MSSYRLRVTVRGTGVYDDGAGLRDVAATGAAVPDLSVALDQATAETWQQVVLVKSVVAGTPQDIDLNGSLVDKAGRTVTFTKLYLAVLSVTTPDGTKQIEWGPLAQPNAAQLWFGATTGSEKVDTQVIHSTNYGWTITAGTGDILRIQNPGAGTVGCTIWLVGKQ